MTAVTAMVGHSIRLGQFDGGKELRGVAVTPRDSFWRMTQAPPSSPPATRASPLKIDRIAQNPKKNASK
jgi:hypothetical protein